MCRRDTTDVLVRRFLDHYHANLLSPPGRRVRCGSVYIMQGGEVTAPGMLSDIVDPKIKLQTPFREPLPDLTGTWSDSVSAKAGLGLLEGFLAAVGAAGLITEAKASAEKTGSREIAFKFTEVTRASLSVTRLGAALADRRLVTSNTFVQPGNRYFVVGAVLYSPSISIQGRDKNGGAVDLGVGVAEVVDANAGVTVEHGSDSDVVYKGGDPLAIGVELYELRWDAQAEEFAFQTPKGPLKLRGMEEDDEPPESVFLSEDALIAVEETEEAAPVGG